MILRGTRIVAGAWLAAFAMWGTLLSMVPVLARVGADLSVGASSLGLVLSVPILALAAIAPLGGFLADRIGPRKIGTVGLLLVGIGGLLRSLSGDLVSLLSSVAVLGIGWGLGLPTLPKAMGE